jgi:hypothetical protein
MLATEFFTINHFIEFLIGLAVLAGLTYLFRKYTPLHTMPDWVRTFLWVALVIVLIVFAYETFVTRSVTR